MEKTVETGEIRVEKHDVVLNWLCRKEPIQRNMTGASLQAGKGKQAGNASGVVIITGRLPHRRATTPPWTTPPPGDHKGRPYYGRAWQGAS